MGKVKEITELQDLRKKAGFSQVEFSHLLLVPVRTYVRWETGETEPSELGTYRVEEVKALLKHAFQVFEPHSVSKWFTTSKALLGGKRPLDIARMVGGIQRLHDFLGQMEWGITA